MLSYFNKLPYFTHAIFSIGHERDPGHRTLMIFGGYVPGADMRQMAVATVTSVRQKSAWRTKFSRCTGASEIKKVVTRRKETVPSLPNERRTDPRYRSYESKPMALFSARRFSSCVV